MQKEKGEGKLRERKRGRAQQGGKNWDNRERRRQRNRLGRWLGVGNARPELQD